MRVQYPLPGMRSKTLSPGFTPASAISGPGLRRASAASRWALRPGSASARSNAGCENGRGASAFLQPTIRVAASARANDDVPLSTSGAERSTGRRSQQLLLDELTEDLCGFALRGRDEAGELFVSEGAGAEKTLVEVAAPFDEQPQLPRALHALDHDLQFELAGKLDQRLHHNPVAAPADDIGDEAPVDLEHVERQRRQIGEAGVAGAEIVDRNPQARFPQSAEPHRDRLLGDEQRALGDFGRHPFRIDSGRGNLRQQPFVVTGT